MRASRAIGRTLICLSLGLGVASAAAAQPQCGGIGGGAVEVMAINREANTDSGPWGAGNRHGFELTPPAAVSFDCIEAKLGSNVPWPIELTVYTQRNGTVLATGSVVPALPFVWTGFALDASVTFTAGSPYFLAFSSPNGTGWIPGVLVGGATALPWWYSGIGSSFFDVPFGSASPGFRFMVLPVFADGFETGDLQRW
ncbi:MAG: hypothetical protein IPJ17_10155 [Holophagales bacterium]|nr:MAG: hypothetical protein IPJ17_10155 [Holophagales bacterium]